MSQQLFQDYKEQRRKKKLTTEVANTKGLENNEPKQRFVDSKIAKEIYKCQHKVFIDKPMKYEISMMINILSNPKEYNLETHIAHIAKRDPDFITLGDTCLEAEGGYFKNLFWWHVEWSDKIKALTLKYLRITRRCHISKELVSINLFEFVIEIINYAAITVFVRENFTACSHEFPLLQNWIDNITA